MKIATDSDSGVLYTYTDRVLQHIHWLCTAMF